MSRERPVCLKEVDWLARYSGETGDPLRNFYIPALSRSVAYDRKAGFFSSTALAVAAEGVARLSAASVMLLRGGRGRRQ